MNKEISELGKLDCKTSHMAGKILRAEGSWSGGRRRILAQENRAATYHVMSRTTGGDFLFQDEEKDGLVKLIWKMAAFLGVKVNTFCVMSNHFHILLHVPAKEKFLRKFMPLVGEGMPALEVVVKADGSKQIVVSLAPWEERLLKHLATFYSKAYMNQLTNELLAMRKQGREQEITNYLKRYTDRFCCVQHYAKEVKERFSRWYNKKHGRRGTLWMDRFKSVLVEDGAASQMMAGYIDLNPVRAGMVNDPADYKWCGYAEAEQGSKRAKQGLCRAMGVAMDSWAKHRNYYRMYLFDSGVERTDEKGRLKRKGGSKSQRDEHLKALGVGRERGRQALKFNIRERVRSFSLALVMGTKEFIEQCGEGLGWTLQRRSTVELE